MKGIDATCVSDCYSKQKRRSNAILEKIFKEYPQLSTVAYLQIPAAHLASDAFVSFDISVQKRAKFETSWW